MSLYVNRVRFGLVSVVSFCSTHNMMSHFYTFKEAEPLLPRTL